jgi:hypothetical protein
MKKWMYVISVGSMLTIFLVFFLSESKKHAEKERQRSIEVAAKKAAEDARKQAIEAQAREDAAKRAAQRAADEAKKEAEKLAKWQAEGEKIQEATDKYNAEADRSAKLAADLEVQLSSLRTAKEIVNREAFELAKVVERGKIDRRAAEMEIQRTTEMVAQKAAQSSLTRAPAVIRPPAP